VLAVEKFSKAFERTPVTGVTSTSLADRRERLDWARAPKGGALEVPWPPRAEPVVVEHEGAGHPWVTIASRAAIPLTAPLSTGLRVEKRLTAIEARTPGRWSRGDLVRVTLTVEAQADTTWVVIDDPIPAGASHLGGGLATRGAIAAQGGAATTAWPAFEERAFEAFRAYYDYVPKGVFTVEYTIRLNQGGRFTMPPTRAEALYAPELLGETPQPAIEVLP